MNYHETLDYIYSFVDYGLKSRYKYSPETFDLTRMRILLARLGDPQRRTPSVHVAGTKGKGSVSAMAASMLQAAGFRMGLYTSPHLDDFCERIQFDGHPIPSDELAALTTELRPLFGATPGITTFELTTALAHVWFARQRADFAVLEVGLGGRLDATNVLLPNVCAITSISFDHTHLLGDSLPEIAEEKSGIIKPGVPVVSSPQKPEVAERIAAVARERGSRLIVAGRDWLFRRESYSLAGQTFTARAAEAPPEPVTRFALPLLGRHQIENAAVALAVVDQLRQQGFTIPPEAAARGLASVQWPGRFEVIQKEKPIVLDCAHNRDSAARLAATLVEMFPGARPALIFGASDDKDVHGMLAELLPLCNRVITARADHPRAGDPEQLAAAVRAVGVALSVNVAHTVSDALAEARQGPEPLVLVTGSIFLVAAVRAALTARVD
nr:bifunctional folylpolyglutamate synthase/dihydrofolate synthase [Chloroflexota bacterium]